MGLNTKKNIASLGGTKPLIRVDPSLDNFENHPFFENKVKRAKALLNKVGLPKKLSSKTLRFLFVF